jgi:hypothetical protein
MPLNTTDDPVVQARQLIAEARQQFAQDVDAILAGLSLELRALVLARFNEYVPLRRLADPVLLQLVQEAYDHFENPDSTVDVRDWIREARKVVAPIDPRRI